MKGFFVHLIKGRWLLPTLITLVILLLLSAAALAQTGGGYDLTWSSIDGGGHTFSTGGGYELGGTVGQPDAGAMAGGGYTLSGGFWGGGGLSGAAYNVYLPIVLRQ